MFASASQHQFRSDGRHIYVGLILRPPQPDVKQPSQQPSATGAIHTVLADTR